MCSPSEHVQIRASLSGTFLWCPVFLLNLAAKLSDTLLVLAFNQLASSSDPSLLSHVCLQHSQYLYWTLRCGSSGFLVRCGVLFALLWQGLFSRRLVGQGISRYTGRFRAFLVTLPTRVGMMMPPCDNDGSVQALFAGAQYRLKLRHLPHNLIGDGERVTFLPTSFSYSRKCRSSMISFESWGTFVWLPCYSRYPVAINFGFNQRLG